MEEEKKKKRNKKKKNKQNKAAEEVAGGDVETASSASVDQNHVSNGQHNYHSEVSETADVENDAVRNTDMDLNRHHQPNGAEGSTVAEAEKQQWLQRETISEETIRQLQNENYLLIQNKAKLEGTIRELQNENNSHIQKEAILQGTIRQLRNENDSHIQKEGGQEMKIAHLQSEKVSWLQKEAGLEEKIIQLLDEKTALGLKWASLEEKFKCLESEKDSWILKENSTKETLASLNDDITRLQAQVLELENSRNNLLQENQQLMGNISTLQSQIQNLERSISSTRSSDELTKHGSEHEDLDSQMEAACALVDKLITENAELVEKVNELYVELDQRRATAGRSSSFPSDQMDGTAETTSVADPMSESIENLLSVAVPKLESPEVLPIKDERNGGDNVDAGHVAVIPNYSETDESGEIVQIPLDENEVRDLELRAAEVDEKDAVPLTDAPLIGAPFRLISFVTKYVSGADLVNKS